MSLLARRKKLTTFGYLFIFGLLPNTAQAACAAIETVTNTSYLMLSFVDGRAAPADFAGTDDGRLVYDATNKALKLCNGDSWVTLMTASTIPAGGDADGQVQYRSSSGTLTGSVNLVMQSNGLNVLQGGNHYYGWGVVPYANLPANDLDLTRGNSGGQTAPYRLNYHTGLSLSAHTNYGGIRFYNQGYASGQQAAYLAADGASMVMAITNGRVGIRTHTPTTALTVNGQISGGFGTWATTGTLDWNHISNARSGNGDTLLLGTATNGPSTGTGYYYYPFSFEYNKSDGTGNMTQFAIPYGNPNFPDTQQGLYIRSRYSNVWGSWRFIPMQAVSDYRVKENVTPMTGGIDAIMRIKPVRYTHTLNQNTEDGFIAHELAQVAPYAVKGEKDAVSADGTAQYQSVDYGRLTPIITQAMQELKAENDALRARIEALEAELGR